MWHANECDWNAYGCYIESLALRFGYDRFLALGASDKVEQMYEWLVAANDAFMAASAVWVSVVGMLHGGIKISPLGGGKLKGSVDVISVKDCRRVTLNV